ncbi:hypothetical protein Tco_0870618 [Tanacetum coccineum]
MLSSSPSGRFIETLIPIRQAIYHIHISYSHLLHQTTLPPNPHSTAPSRAAAVHGKIEAGSRPKSKNDKVRVNTEESAVKPEPELKNTIECNLYPSDGPGKPNSIIMKTVKTKWALNQLQQPICVQLTKTVKTLKAQS